MRGSSKVDPGQIIERIVGVLGVVPAVADISLAAKLTGQSNPVVVVTPETEEQLCVLMQVAYEGRSYHIETCEGA